MSPPAWARDHTRTHAQLAALLLCTATPYTSLLSIHKDSTLRLHPPTPAPAPAAQPGPVIDPGHPGATDAVIDRVRQILNLIRPAVQADGGDIELVGITPDKMVQIRMHGACVDCPSSAVTLQTGIARNLKQHVPEVAGVQAVD